MERQEKVWTPKEIKQKEVVWFHFMGRPVTERQLIFIIAGILISVGIYFLSLKIIPIKADTFIEQIEQNMPRIAFSIFVIAMSIIIASPDKYGKYREERIITKIKYINNSAILLNHKAAQGKKAYKEGGPSNGK